MKTVDLIAGTLGLWILLSVVGTGIAMAFVLLAIYGVPQFAYLSVPFALPAAFIPGLLSPSKRGTFLLSQLFYYAVITLIWRAVTHWRSRTRRES